MIRIEVFSDSLTLAATEILFADGSRMRNKFSGIQLSAEIDKTLFEIPMESGYQIVYPLQQKK